MSCVSPAPVICTRDSPSSHQLRNNTTNTPLPLLLHFILPPSRLSGGALSPIMDVVAAVSGYISKMVTAGESATGSSSTKMKILLLDSETVGDALCS
ncbi:Vacuolar protein sorting-associated protein 45 [Penicillium lagena]|uniref:Vacuolar protein sorting-associated protein 45 n=1 Tax=Penicillium lagena TaxID=94218 RepID=UPI0025415712|nr:Vacuolar protein sorting-associated protein 45 [Penicillium lagena]KAJ5612336.1 Vacuolar protein sorting-associated protein 45 [Penicillium lagena]